MPDHTRRLKSATIAALAFVALSPAGARAQSSQAARDREARRIDMEMRQRTLRDLDKSINKKPSKAPDARPAYNEVAEEFKRLQLVNYSLAGMTDPKVPLDYARVRKESAEVRKRAARLKSFLSLPEVEADDRQDKADGIQTPEALRAAVGRLDSLVNSFAWNPVFQKPDVVNLEQSAKASRDLAGILGLSELIRKSAEELGRSVAKK
jgi:dGTP triphosphohydrolase